MSTVRIMRLIHMLTCCTILTEGTEVTLLRSWSFFCHHAVLDLVEGFELLAFLRRFGVCIWKVDSLPCGRSPVKPPFRVGLDLARDSCHICAVDLALRCSCGDGCNWCKVALVGTISGGLVLCQPFVPLLLWDYLLTDFVSSSSDERQFSDHCEQFVYEGANMTLKHPKWVDLDGFSSKPLWNVFDRCFGLDYLIAGPNLSSIYMTVCKCMICIDLLFERCRERERGRALICAGHGRWRCLELDALSPQCSSIFLCWSDHHRKRRLHGKQGDVQLHYLGAFEPLRTWQNRFQVVSMLFHVVKNWDDCAESPLRACRAQDSKVQVKVTKFPLQSIFQAWRLKSKLYTWTCYKTKGETWRNHKLYTSRIELLTRHSRRIDLRPGQNMQLLANKVADDMSKDRIELDNKYDAVSEAVWCCLHFRYSHVPKLGWCDGWCVGSGSTWKSAPSQGLGRFWLVGPLWVREPLRWIKPTFQLVWRSQHGELWWERALMAGSWSSVSNSRDFHMAFSPTALHFF